jgi:hypothetical protein
MSSGQPFGYYPRIQKVSKGKKLVFMFKWPAVRGFLNRGKKKFIASEMQGGVPQRWLKECFKKFESLGS